MKKLFILMALCSVTEGILAQHSQRGNVQFSLSAGGSNHSYTADYFGWFVNLELTKKVFKQLDVGIKYLHSSFSDFPGKFQVFPYQSQQNQAIIEHWKGISETQWRSGKKGFFYKMTGDIIGAQAAYTFLIRNKFFIAPKIGITRITSTYLDVGLFQASFINEKLVGGEVGYDVRNAKLTGWFFGLELGYQLNGKWKLFIDLEDNRDIDGSGYYFYEAKQAGAGFRYSF